MSEGRVIAGENASMSEEPVNRGRRRATWGAIAALIGAGAGGEIKAEGFGPASDSATPVQQGREGKAVPLFDPALEERALALGRQLRCVVCQNQSIAESNASLAHDLMNEVRQMLGAGKTEQEVIEFLVARYGEFVLFKPPLDVRTAVLWGGPFALGVGAVAALWWSIHRRRSESQPLSEEERRVADRLLAEGESTGDQR
ncbi:MAG: cytochrome c-type biogenesis protein CcmH [Hydrogenophilus sp.]|nr:cytochrome c-type biogenesis protein CcmH [Hydrogenophilus sp.]